ncbi:MAG TPA: glycosyltransferase [Chthoniobacter sp.]|nr:glycosyltransferase [Chthoniobacter sp.]
MKRTRILFVLGDMGGGGAERVVVECLAGLDRSRFQPVLALGELTGPYLAEIPGDVAVIDLGGAACFHRTHLRAFIAQLWKIIFEHQIDLIASTTILPNTALSRARLLWPGMPPLVLLQQDNLTAETNQRADGLKRQILRAELRTIFRCSTHVACASAGVRRDLIESFGLKPDCLSTVRNGLPIDRIRSAAQDSIEWPWPEDTGTKTMIAVGRLVAQKAYPDLLRAFARVRETTPVRLIVLGVGPLETELRELSAQLGLGDTVSFVGFQRNPWAWMTQSDLFVLSSYHEGLGNVLIEAMACGVPILATDCPHGPGEIIEDGFTGRLVPPGDVDSLAATMQELLTDEDTRTRMAENAAAQLDRFDSASMVRQYEALFARVLGKALPEEVAA